MRLQDDEIRFLRCLSNRTAMKVTFDRAEAIVKKFRYHGLLDENEELTTRGQHVAAKLPPLPEPLEPVIPLEEITTIEETEWD